MSYADIRRNFLCALAAICVVVVALLLSLAHPSSAAATKSRATSVPTTASQASYTPMSTAQTAYEAIAARTYQTTVRANHAARTHLAVHTYQTPRTYVVRSGNTLSEIAQRFYGTTSAWPCIYDANKAAIHDPNDLSVGLHLLVPVHLKTTGCWAPHPAWKPHPTYASTASYQPSYTGSFGGTLSCSGLSALWIAAGGSPSAAWMAAKIGMAESSGEQYAHSPTNDIGYWQINVAAHGAMATYDPFGNAHAAISISGNGSSWGPWATYTSGAYLRYC